MLVIMVRIVVRPYAVVVRVAYSQFDMSVMTGVPCGVLLAAILAAALVLYKTYREAWTHEMHARRKEHLVQVARRMAHQTTSNSHRKSTCHVRHDGAHLHHHSMVLVAAR